MYIALLSRADNFHSQAKAVAAMLQNVPTVTSEPVIIEVLNFFSSRGPILREAATKFLEALLDSETRIVPQTPELFKSGVALYRNRFDKDFSLTDCMSMQICHEGKIDQVATHDAGFRQEGFNILFP